MPSILWQAAAAVALTLASIATADAVHVHAGPAVERPAGDPHCESAAGDCVDLTAVVVDDIEIAGAWARAMLQAQPTGGVYLTIINRGTAAERLVGAASPRAGRVEIHEMDMEGDVMKMRPVEGGVEIGPGETVELAPGGLHLMVLDVRGPFAEGEQVPVTLEFENAGKAEISVEVRAAAPAASGGGHHRH